VEQSQSDLVNHEDLLRSLPTPSTGVELGVGSGDSLLLFTSLWPNSLWIGVDKWVDPTTHLLEWSAAKLAAKTKLSSKKVVLLQGYFSSVVPKLRSHRFDIVHIDGSHDLFSVYSDYESALSLVSPSGVILFHDIIHPYCDVHLVWQELKKGHCFKESLVGDCGLGAIFL